MKAKRYRPVMIVSCALIMAVAACSPFGRGTQQPTKNYVLNSLYSEKTIPQPLTDLSNIGILVGPVSLAQYLDRTDIVIRNTRNEIEIAEFSAWAGPLRENFSRVLAENLSLWLNSEKVAIFPQSRLPSFNYNVTMTVTRFDGRPGHQAQLRARWMVLDQRRTTTLFNGHTVLTQPAENDGIAGMIESQSRLIADFSRQIAEAIKELEASKAGN